MKKFGYKTVMQVPRIKKITLNMGVGETVNDKKVLDHAVADMTKIAGQKPVVTKARKSIANFKVRAGYPGRLHGDPARRAHVRIPRPPGEHRHPAHPRLPRRVEPRLRRPRQLQPRGQGTDHLPGDRIRQDRRPARASNIAITTTAKTDDEARALLTAFRFPFKVDRSSRIRASSRNRTSKNRKADNHGQALSEAPRKETPQDGRQVQGKARRAARGDPRRQAPPTRTATRRAPSCRSCRATLRRCACATAAR